MITIGVYDSGAGGLNVLAEIVKKFAGAEIYYYADNAHAPLGALDDAQLADALADGLANVQANSDVTVVACNTASTFLHELARGTKYEDKTQNKALILSKCDDKVPFKPIVGILPPMDEESVFPPVAPYCPGRTLLLATEGTKRRLKPKVGMRIASTPELASMIEIALEEPCDMSSLLPYLHEKLDGFVGVKNVVLGCTHYPFCKRQISEVLGRVRFSDGTPALLFALSRFVTPNPDLSAPIKFAFSGKDETKKFSRLLEHLINGM